MNLTSPVLKGTAPIAEVPGGSAASLFKLADDSPDGALGMLMSGLSGVAAALAAITESRVELVTDRNQKLARMQPALASDANGRTVIRGSVTLDYRTTDRVMVLHLPGQPQRLFKLRLAANPGHSDQFGPWHLVDRIASPGGEAARELNDAYAIRYRVL